MIDLVVIAWYPMEYCITSGGNRDASQIGVIVLSYPPKAFQLLGGGCMCILGQLVRLDQHDGCILRRLCYQKCRMRMGVYVAIQPCLFIVPSLSTLWTECSTCFTTGAAAWTCPAALDIYADIGGVGADIVEVDFEEGERSSSRAHAKHPTTQLSRETLVRVNST